VYVSKTHTGRKEEGREISVEVRLTLLPWGFTSSRLSCGLLYCQ
jgi:hypothetical protein